MAFTLAGVLITGGVLTGLSTNFHVFGTDKVWQFHLSMTAAEYQGMQPAQGGFPGFGAPPPPKPERKPGERETHRGAFNIDFPWAEAAFTGRAVAVHATEVDAPGLLAALRVALESVLDEEAAGNERFKKILANWRQFRTEQHRWFSIADTRAELAVYRSDTQR